MKDELKRLMNEWKEAEKKSDELDAKWDENPDDEEIEAAWDEAYKASQNTFNALAKALSDMTNGEMDFATSRAVLGHFPERIEDMINRLA